MIPLFFAIFTLSVDESNYRQCEQSKFCYRNREVGKQHWSILQNSIKYEKDYFMSFIQDETNDKVLIYKVFFLQSGIRYRIEPSESESVKRYHTAEDRSIINRDELNITRPYSHTDNRTHIFLIHGDVSITIQIKPFTSTITSKRGKIVTINPDDTAIFEHNRDRNRFPRLFDVTDFNGVIDKTPNGPTSVAMDFFFHGNSVRFHGLPEHTLNLTLPYTTHRLKRRGEIEYHAISDPIRLFNVDINQYEIGNPMAMYGAIPFLLARDSQKSTGLFWCNPSETWVDLSEEKLGCQARFLSEGGFIDFFVFLGSDHREVLKKYTQLTGRPQLVQGFALGYHQSRWDYKSTEEIRGVMKGLDEAQIPHDSIWLDLDHTDDKMYFTFNPYTFKDIKEVQDEADPLERKVVALVDPHLRVDYGYKQFEQALNSRMLLRTRLDSEYEAECWPGVSAWVDFLNPWARIWWETQFEFDNYKGSTLSLYIWNDMNEPSVFEVPDGTCPRDLVHFRGYENREVHNIYGHLMTSATFGGLTKRVDDGDDRPFVLTRSFFAGTQRYAVTWTGDNKADWDHLAASIPMVLTLGLAGMPYAGADVGGFFESPSPALLVRWYQLGAWCYPFFREHCHHKSERREPYTLKRGYLDGARTAIHERYMTHPYWYTLARHANLSGTPLVRPVWWEFPNDRRWADSEDRFMVGSSIIVFPILHDQELQRKVELPFARWYDFRTLKEVTDKENAVVLDAPMNKIPVLVRGGSIVPLKMWRRRTTFLQMHDPFTLLVALDEEGEARGEVYIDDEQTTAFMKGEYIHRRFLYAGGVLSSRAADSKQARGEFYNDYRVKIERVRIAGFRTPPSKVKGDDGEDLEIDWDPNTGVLTIHRANLPVKESWALTFEFTGEMPPIRPSNLDTPLTEEELEAEKESKVPSKATPTATPKPDARIDSADL